MDAGAAPTAPKELKGSCDRMYSGLKMLSVAGLRALLSSAAAVKDCSTSSLSCARRSGGTFHGSGPVYSIGCGCIGVVKPGPTVNGREVEV